VENCSIVEKHLALSILNKEKQQFLQQINDKHRSKMARENLMKQQVNESPYQAAKSKHMHAYTLAPDMVKLKKKDIEKVLGGDKKEEK
jgi:hypothetical protein